MLIWARRLQILLTLVLYVCFRLPVGLFIKFGSICVSYIFMIKMDGNISSIYGWIGIYVAVGFTDTLLDIYMLRYMKNEATCRF